MRRNNKQVYAIIQARMGSARLPGKVLMDLCGRPMLWHIVNRLKRCNELTGIAIATSTSKEDDKIVEFAKRYRIRTIRGSKEDVLKRYIDAAESLKADYIVRVCGDSPLIEPHEIDRLIKTVKTHNADYTIAYPGIPSIHEGFSAVSLSALKKVYSAPDIKDYHKEHVTIYLKEHPDSVKTVHFKPAKAFQKTGHRISVDNMADLKFMREIYKRFWNKKEIVDLKQVVKYLEDNPEIKNINAHVTQKSKNENSRKIAFIIEGGEKLGFGHFNRTTQIAGYLVENKNCGVIFITNSSVLYRRIKKLGFKPFYIKQAHLVKSNSGKICRIIKKENPESVVIDVKNNHDPSDIIRSLRKTSGNIKIALIDNVTKARLLADKNIYPGIDAGIKNINWKNYKGDIYSGVKYFPLRDEFARAKTAKKNGDCVVVTMGAADVNNVTPFIMKALINTGKKVKVIIGPAFKRKREIKTIASRHKNIFELYENPHNYAQIIASSSLAVTALGISIYEISHLGVPIMVIGNYESDSKAGRILEKKGYCKYMGYYKNITQDDARLHAAKLWAVKSKTPVKAGKNGTKNISEVILS